MKYLAAFCCAKLPLAVAGQVRTALGAMANNLGENSDWQLGSTQDKVNKTATPDQIPKKQAGYHDALRPVYNNTFEPQIITKHQTRWSAFDDKILSLCARGMTVREIQSHGAPQPKILGLEIAQGSGSRFATDLRRANRVRS